MCFSTVFGLRFPKIHVARHRLKCCNFDAFLMWRVDVRCAIQCGKQVIGSVTLPASGLSTIGSVIDSVLRSPHGSAIGLKMLSLATAERADVDSTQRINPRSLQAPQLGAESVI
jgi:hypothetical protein